MHNVTGSQLSKSRATSGPTEGFSRTGSFVEPKGSDSRQRLSKVGKEVEELGDGDITNELDDCMAQRMQKTKEKLQDDIYILKKVAWESKLRVVARNEENRRKQNEAAIDMSYLMEKTPTSGYHDSKGRRGSMSLDDSMEQFSKKVGDKKTGGLNVQFIQSAVQKKRSKGSNCSQILVKPSLGQLLVIDTRYDPDAELTASMPVTKKEETNIPVKQKQVFNAGDAERSLSPVPLSEFQPPVLRHVVSYRGENSRFNAQADPRYQMSQRR